MGAKKQNTKSIASSATQLGADLRAFVDERMQRVAVLFNKFERTVRDLSLRVDAHERLAGDLLPEDKVIQAMCDIQDDREGYKRVDEPAQKFDRIRATVVTQLKENQPSPEQQIVINEVGTGKSLPPDIEEKLLGVVAGETRESVLGEEPNTAKLTIKVTSVSRNLNPPKEEAEAKEEVDVNDSNEG